MSSSALEAGTSGERQPLLGNPGSSSTSPELNGNEHSAADANEAQKTPVSRTEMAVYGLLTVLGITFVAIFIKGFIDAHDVDFDFKKALKSALGGGLSGAAGVFICRACSGSVLIELVSHGSPGPYAHGKPLHYELPSWCSQPLQPLRTVMNFQYRYGTSTSQAISTLYADGGWTRYYQGLSAALIQGPVSRFGDTAANAGILALLQSNTYMRQLPALVKTIFASVAAALFRMILTPIDTVKTTLQTQGKRGWAILKNRVRVYGLGSLFYGAWATAAATFVGHYPWFGTYNYLDANLPEPHTTLQKLARRAFIGFSASIVSDTISNSLRVVKTYRQVNETRIGYLSAAKAVIAVDGWRGLLGRGLKTRILANGLQGIMFTILWRWFMDIWNDTTKLK
ncbi:hypothetical protein AX16_001857 [Volvariella volvacea WC 439]|nr:hypothetical protein AX16_001857 [Volvariella volvacea WC 439]